MFLRLYNQGFANVKNVLASTIAAIGMTIASSAFLPAQAFSLFLDPEFGSTENTGSKAQLDFNFVQSGNDVLLNLGITNATNGTGGLKATQATLVGLAFDLTPNLKVASYSAGDSGFTKLWSNAELNPYGSFTVGISPQRNSFAGGNPRDGLGAGSSTNVSFRLTGQGLKAAEVEQTIYAGINSGSLRAVGRFQQVNAGGGSDKVLGGVRPDPEPTPTEVPEPSTALALGLFALRAIGATNRTQAKATVSAES